MFLFTLRQVQGVHFLLYSYFCSKIPIFSLIWHKTYRYLHFCSYTTIGATVEILILHSVHIMVHLNIGLTDLKHRGDVCTHLYLHL